MNGLAEGMKVTYDIEADRRSGKDPRNEFEGGLIRGMFHGGRRASVRCPPLRITRTKMSLPCCVRAWNPAPRPAALRVILGKTRREHLSATAGH